MKLYLAVFPFLANGRETPDDFRFLFPGQDANESQRLGICDRAANIGGVHPLVVFQRLIECVHPVVSSQQRWAVTVRYRGKSQWIRLAREAATP